MRIALVVVVSLALVAALEAAFYARRYFKQRKLEQLHRRLRALGTGRAGDVTLLRPGRLAKSAALDELLQAVALARRLERLLEQADVGFTVARLLGYSAAAAAGLTLVGLVAGAGALATVGLGIAGAAAPTLLVLSAREQRSRKLSEQLPDALDMMARSLRAGHALTGAFQLLASELPQPISIEFGRAYEEQQLGSSVERAVLNMSERAPTNRDLKIFGVSIVVQRETGGNLSEILENIAGTIRARYRFYGKLRSLTAEGRTSALVLAALPVLMFLLLAVMSGPYVGLLFTEPLGRRILGYAVVSWVAGLVWLQRMTKVEF